MKQHFKNNFNITSKTLQITSKINHFHHKFKHKSHSSIEVTFQIYKTHTYLLFKKRNSICNKIYYLKSKEITL